MRRDCGSYTSHKLPMQVLLIMLACSLQHGTQAVWRHLLWQEAADGAQQRSGVLHRAVSILEPPAASGAGPVPPGMLSGPPDAAAVQERQRLVRQQAALRPLHAAAVRLAVQAVMSNLRTCTTWSWLEKGVRQQRAPTASTVNSSCETHPTPGHWSSVPATHKLCALHVA